MGYVFVIIILILLVGDLTKLAAKSNKEALCTGCGSKLKDDYIVVKEYKLVQPLNYCTAQCKIDHIVDDRIKYTEIDLVEATFG